MTNTSYYQICCRIEKRDESVPIKNIKSGALGYAFGCAGEGEVIHVRKLSGELDSWSRPECVEYSLDRFTLKKSDFN